jgi:N-acetylglucosamine malate deacetylase 2
MNKKILAVFAHPDDEAFGPGGTLAKYAHEGVEIHLLCATKGESGEYSEEARNKSEIGVKPEIKLHHIREKELLESAKVLGVKKVEFMDFIDGTLCNNNYHQIADKVVKKIADFRPQIVLTNERLGISGHIDHITISMATTYAFKKSGKATKLYYNCMNRKYREKILDKYFIYFPEGYTDNEITTRIDYSKYWKYKKSAMMKHKSQWKDVAALLLRFAMQPKIDHFILQHFNRIKPKFPETDLFDGII